jgi:hypothetical protein
MENTRFQYMNVFEVENRSRFKWLNYFFLKGNCLSLPSSLVRAECFEKLGLFHPAYANIQDLDLWIRICLKSDIHILDQKLIKNRWISNESNASGDNITSRIRVSFEYKSSLDHFLTIKNPKDFKLVFPLAPRYGAVLSETIPYILGRIAIDTELDFKMGWGMGVIYEMLHDEKLAQILSDKCGFTYLDFIKLAGRCDTFRISVGWVQPVIKLSAFRRFLSASKQYLMDSYRIFLGIFGKVPNK